MLVKKGIAIVAQNIIFIRIDELKVSAIPEELSKS